MKEILWSKIPLCLNQKSNVLDSFLDLLLSIKNGRGTEVSSSGISATHSNIGNISKSFNVTDARVMERYFLGFF